MSSQVATYCADKLHNSLAKEIRRCSSKPKDDSASEKPMLEALSATFNRLDAEVSGLARTNSEGMAIDGSEPIAAETVGTTAVAALIGGGRIIVANCGDSRAVLSRGGEAVPLSTDHKVSCVTGLLGLGPDCCCSMLLSGLTASCSRVREMKA